MKPWFKHYNVAHNKKCILDLQEKLGYHRGYAAYFLLVEHCHSIWDGHSEPIFDIAISKLKSITGQYEMKLISMLDVMQFHCNLTYISNGKQINLHFHKLLEVQDKDSKYNRKQIASESLPLKEKEKEKEKETIYRRVEGPVKEEVTLKSKASEILEYLNAKHKRRFRSVDSNLQPIINFLKAGYTQDDAADIVDTKAKDPFFKKNNRLLNPQTLFRKSHYGKYLEEAERCQKL